MGACAGNGLEKCPICSNSCRLIYSSMRFDAFRCDSCELVFRNNRPEEHELIGLYDDVRYVESALFANWHDGYDPNSPEIIMFKKSLGQLALLSPGKGALLDVGCSKGLFLHLAREEGWKTHGVEISRVASEYARSKFELDVITGTLEEAGYPEASMDVVTLWDIIEHLENPLSTLHVINRILKPGGILIILTPNFNSLISNVAYFLYKFSCHLVRKPIDLIFDYHHNYYFTHQSIQYCLDKAGLGLIERVDGLGAHVQRWQDVESYPRVLEIGSSLLDFVASKIGKPYRMIIYARKLASASTMDAPTSAPAL